MKEQVKYATFQAFRPHFDALAKVAYFKVVMRPISGLKLQAHTTFRIIVWVLIILYNVQLIIRVLLDREKMDQVVDTLFVLLTTLNTLGKHITFNAKSDRIDGLISVINGPYFAATKLHHVELMKDNAKAMSDLLRLYHVSVISCGILFGIYPLVNKVLGEDVSLVGYIPFDTSTSPAFEIAVVYMCILLTFQGYGHVTMDCTIVSFYAQSKTQLQLLRYNLQHLDYTSDGAVELDEKLNAINNVHIAPRSDVHRRLAFCVEHYQKIVWFTQEVQSIFSEAMVLQFFVMSWVICMTVYKIVGVTLLSAEFLCIILYLGCMLAQLFLYCYYGTQIRFQSELINESIYCGDWISASSRLRRMLLIMMIRCTRPIAPQTAYIIQLSLETYVSVLKFSYTLFTLIQSQ